MKGEKFYKITIILAIVGIVLASFLFYNFLTKPIVEVCTINDQVNCDAVTKGTLSTLFGIPVSLIGLVGYVAILISAFLKNKKAVFGVSAFGMLFCLRLTFLELFSVKIICPVCLACQIDMLALFLLLLISKNLGHDKSFGCCCCSFNVCGRGGEKSPDCNIKSAG